MPHTVLKCLDVAVNKMDKICFITVYILVKEDEREEEKGGKEKKEERGQLRKKHGDRYYIENLYKMV